MAGYTYALLRTQRDNLVHLSWKFLTQAAAEALAGTRTQTDNGYGCAAMTTFCLDAFSRSNAGKVIGIQGGPDDTAVTCLRCLTQEHHDREKIQQLSGNIVR